MEYTGCTIFYLVCKKLWNTIEITRQLLEGIKYLKTTGTVKFHTSYVLFSFNDEKVKLVDNSSAQFVEEDMEEDAMKIDPLMGGLHDIQ